MLHEHTRPDRDNHVDFVCENVKGYEDAKIAATADEHHGFDDDVIPEERIRAVYVPPLPFPVAFLAREMGQCSLLTLRPSCTRYLPASYFFPYLVSTFLRGDKQGGDLAWSATIADHSGPYDYESIMGYDSWAGQDEPGSDKFPIKRKGVPAGSLNNPGPGMIYQGGNPIHARRSISVGDICRIAQRYPKDRATTDRACGLVSWSLAGPVVIGSVPLKYNVRQAPGESGPVQIPPH